MSATGVAMGLAEWIIDDTCLVLIRFTNLFPSNRYGIFALFFNNLQKNMFPGAYSYGLGNTLYQ